MNTTIYRTGKNIIPRLYSPAIWIVLLAVIAGCAGSGNYGRLQRSRDVDQIFRTYRVLPDYEYYFTGPAGRPDAIMGIRNKYTLETSQWTQFSPYDDTLKKGVDSINFRNNTRVRNYPYGFFILDPEGNRLGIWYSIWDWTTIIVKSDNRIEVFPPGRKDPFENGENPQRLKTE